MIRSVTFPVSIILAAAALSLSGCGTGEAMATGDSNPLASEAVPVEVAYPGRADISASYAATATIDSDRDAAVLARVPGELVALMVEEGDRVKEGQILARLDGERLRLEMLAAKADLERTRREYERFKDLNRRGLVSEAMFDGLGFDVDSLTATYELHKLNYEYSNIRAPISGVVSERMIKPGQTLTTGQEAFRITATEELVAYLQIPQNELAKFENVGNATLIVDSMPDKTFVAKIVRISPTINMENGTFRATASISNDDALLAPGMFGRFQIDYETHRNALTIPVRALLNDDDDVSVYVIKDGEVARQRVVTGFRSGEVVEILDGLSVDDIVVIGQKALREGSKVLAEQSNSGSKTG